MRFYVNKIIEAGDFLLDVIGNCFIDSWEDYLIIEISKLYKRETIYRSLYL